MLRDKYLVCMRGGDEYNRPSSWDTESTAGVHLAEEEIHENCSSLTISDFILYSNTGASKASR